MVANVWMPGHVPRPTGPRSLHVLRCARDPLHLQFGERVSVHLDAFADIPLAVVWRDGIEATRLAAARGRRLLGGPLIRDYHENKPGDSGPPPEPYPGWSN